MQNRFFWVILLFLFLSSGCNGPTVEKNHEAQTVFQVGNRLNGWYSEKDQDDHYLDQVQPILSKRCVTCHGCYEAPCQLNLQSYQGVRRGYDATPIYNMKRLESMPITQMNEVYPLSKWRELTFLPVVANDDEPNSADQAKHWESSLFKTFLEKGSQYNQPGFPLTGPLEKLQNKFKENNNSQCTATSEQFEAHFQAKNPWKVVTADKYFLDASVNGKPSGAGMPFALPALAPEEMAILNTWMQNGARGPSEKAMKHLQTPHNPEVIKKWEQFLNTDSAQGRQTARYIYEHTYTAYLHFDENKGEYFRIARMTKMADNSEGEIITKFPYQLPKEVPQFSYRLKKVTEAIVQKKMIVWRLNDKHLARLNELFFPPKQPWPQPIPEPQYDSSNPFAYFAPIPAKIRARFLIENAYVVVASIAQGAVCLGSGATYGIRDHFWIWFLDPDSDVSVLKPKLGLSSWEILSTGRWSIDEQQMTDKEYAGIFGHLWNKVQGLEHDVDAVKKVVKYYEQTSKDDVLYLKAYERQLRLWLEQQQPKRKGLKVSDIWDGLGDPTYKNGINPNAWLNVTRHERSTTVQRGPEGGAPGSIWVLSFSNFERIYYNLVVNYVPYGNLAMKMGSFRIMTYTRMEAENLAISLLPIEARETIRHEYTKGIGWVASKLFHPLWSLKPLDSEDGELPPRQTGTPELKTLYAEAKQESLNQGKSPKQAKVAAAYAAAYSLIDTTKNHLQKVSQADYKPNAVSGKQKKWEDNIREALMHKTKKENGVQYPEYFPSIAYLKINNPEGKPWVYSIIVDRAYRSNDIISTESLTREPDLDLLTLYRGFVGAYPNVFFELNENQSSTFISDIKEINSQPTWKDLVGKYGISRNSPDFWPFFDWIHAFKANPHPGVEPVMQGIVDVGQYNFFVEN
jgi:hypothetical protein